MLKSVVFENIINFKDRQILKFEDGVNFLIGANSTGKSSIIELIRRCHSASLSSTVSNLLNKEKPGYVICRYEGCSPLLKDIVKGKGKVNPDVALLCLFQEKRKDGSDDIYKCVCFSETTENQPRCIYIAASIYRDNSEINNLDLHELHDFKEQFLDIYFKRNGIAVDIPNLDVELDLLNEVKLLLKKQRDTNDGSKIILNELRPTFASVFAGRSIGPLQWINGNRIGPLDASTNYGNAQKRAEILWDLLPIENGSVQHRPDLMETDDSSPTSPKREKLEDPTKPESDYIDKEMEKSYFARVTYPLEYVFTKRKDKIKVQRKTDERKFELVKAPEGVIEAKQACLVFSHKKFKTICYEDIDRGMHSQMIENLNNFVLKKIEGKTVIIVTHNPSFMNGWAMDRTHVCSRKILDDEQLNVVRKVPPGYKYGVHNEMKKVLFASKVLLVEGTTDQQVLQSLFEYIIDNTQAQDILSVELQAANQSKAEVRHNIVRKICMTQIVAFGSKKMGNGAKFCKEINIPVYTLKDLDKIPEKADFKADFQWRNGTLEDVLKNDCPKTIHKRLKVESTISEAEWKSKYKKELKQKIINEFKDETYIKLFYELFQEPLRKDLEMVKLLTFIITDT